MGIRSIYKKLGGRTYLRQLRKAHVLFYTFVQVMNLGISRKSLEIVRLAVQNKILSKLRKQYKNKIAGFKDLIESNKPTLYTCQQKRCVWVCWLQGMENAPEIVKCCYLSLKRNIKNREIILITNENINDYVKFPDYIQDKIDSGIISKTHMSDLLRLELLSKYGGTWIDATVFCTGSNIPEFMVNSDLFFFQNLKPGLDGHSISISSWFITAKKNNPVIELTKMLMYDYWKRSKILIDYFLIHDFFQLALETYNENYNKIIPFSNSMPHVLLLRLFEEYDKEIFKNITLITPFSKLTYKFTQEQCLLPNTYYQHLINFYR